MDSNQLNEFLQIPLHATVGTTRADGSPQLSPVWYIYENGLFYISITKNTAKYRNLQRDPRISLCIDGGREDLRTVMVSGTVEIIEKGDPRQRPIQGRLIQHYIADPTAAKQYAEESADWESILLIVTPWKVITQNFQESSKS